MTYLFKLCRFYEKGIHFTVYQSDELVSFQEPFYNEAGSPAGWNRKMAGQRWPCVLKHHFPLIFAILFIKKKYERTIRKKYRLTETCLT
jgi:hypothetical protein